MRATSILGSLLLLFMGVNAYGQLYINEIMASNGSTIADEAGEFDDWIEIYNGGTQDVNLAGYYFSDDPNDPQKWQIPADNPTQTTVPASGFLLLWADNDPGQGAHHLGFKLSSAGEEITLSHPDGSSLINQISFVNQTLDISYGRSSDGGNDFQLFSDPSPGASNNNGGGVLTFPVELSIPVNGDPEDAEENEDGTVDVEGFGLRLGEDFNGSTTVGLRFQIDLPAGAIIQNANIKFKAAGADDSAPANWAIRAQLDNNAAPFSTNIFNVSQRPLTNAIVNWSPVAWSSNNPDIGVDEDFSPNLANLLQEVIDLNGWQEGNSVVFIISGTGMRNCFAGDASNNNIFAPLLSIEAEIPYPSDPISNVFINEIAAAGTLYTDENEDREDWIELYNANNFEIDLSGLYLTDNYNDLDKSRIPEGVIIPANGYLTFFADRDEEDGPLHTNFNLRSKGEEVALAMQLSSGLVILDSISFDDAPFMSSFGRQTDAASEWILFGAPTPNASNNGAALYLPPPSVSLSSGIYQGVQNTEITHSLSDVEIRYTTDGNIPDNGSLLYDQSINIFNTQNIRAIAYKAGYAPSQVENAAYVIDEVPNIPIVYLTTAPANFFDDEIGIYVDGTNGIQAFCAPYPVNWAQDWERPVNVKMFLPSGEEVFDVNAGAKITGVCSRNNAMKSLAISLREKDYGNGELGYRLFDDRDHDNYLRFKLRNSGQDYSRMGYRDMVNQALVADKLDIEYQAGRPVLVFLNGEFWGIHNIREKYTGEFFEDNYGIDEDEIDIIKSPGLPWAEVKQGSVDSFNMVFNFVENNSLVDDTNFEYFQSNVDVNAFLSYWIYMTYLGNYDWPANNLTVWREQKAGAKWRYCIADTDGSTNNLLSDRSLPEFNTLDSIMVADSENWPNHSNSTLFLRKLVEREDYQSEFIQRACSFIGLIYAPERAHHFADSIKTLYLPNVQRHLDKWGGDLGAMGGVDIATWESWIDAYKDFYTERPDFFRQHLKNFFELDDTYNLTFVFDEDTPGSVVVNRNEMEMPFNFSNLYFKNTPLRVKAIPKPGASFSHWLETGATNPEIDFVGTADGTLTPIFICTEGTPGTACDDGDECTVNDMIDEDCVCRGVIEDNNMDGEINELDCDCLNGAPGTACDDGDECTVNDVIDEDCNCIGVIEDNNMDGEINELDCDFIDSVDPELEDAELMIFPNPVQNHLTIRLENKTIESIDIFNSSGILMDQRSMIYNSELVYPGKTLPPGIYFIRLKTTTAQYYFGNFSVVQ